MLRHAVRLNSLTELALTKLDVLDGVRRREGVHRATASTAGRRAALPRPLRPARPRRARLRDAARAGAPGSATCARPSDLPPAAAGLIELVEREVGIPVRVVGVGAERDDYVLWR